MASNETGAAPESLTHLGPETLTHLNAEGRAQMVDVSDKATTVRRALARALVKLSPETLALVAAGEAPKGDVIAVARIAGIQAAKRTHELIPLCHQLPLAFVGVEAALDLEAGTIELIAEARTTAQTGVEMEALTAVTVAALTVYDMVKGVERGVSITDVELIEKSGGRSGHWRRET
jgi:cyclic pyranopterin phosphate synthase